MKRDFKEAWKSYMEFSHLSASLFFTELEKKAGLMSPFEEGSIRKLVEGLED
jgi:oligoendopeptidase F